MREDVFETFESSVRYYCRSFPVVFASAKGSTLKDVTGRSYHDFLSGAGTLNYGHNNPAIISAVQEYLSRDGIVHSLDMHTEAKGDFIDAFQEIILRPRGLSFKLQFPGPTGTNAIEAALKLARKVTGRTNVVTFTNAFHGMSLGALAGTAIPRKGAGQASLCPARPSCLTTPISDRKSIPWTSLRRCYVAPAPASMRRRRSS